MLGRDDGPGALHAPVSDVRIDVGGAGDQRKKVVVIGAGFAGLSAACYLAKEGFAVTVIDRLPEVHNARFRPPSLQRRHGRVLVAYQRDRGGFPERAVRRRGIPNIRDKGMGL